MTDRREFLMRLAKGAVYQAPVVIALSAPVRLLAQASGMGMNDMTMGMSMGGGVGQSNAIGAPSPGSVSAPGSTQ